MRLLLLASIAGLAFSVAQATEQFQLPADGVFALPPSQGPAVLKQCSRNTPLGASSFWQPSREEIAALELALAPYLEARREVGARIPPTEQVYHREYVGYARDGRRFIYGNFFPAGDSWPVHRAGYPVAVCDGGPSFWGIVYDVESRRFEEPHFNGQA
jgi:hypothetical protein